MVNYKEYIEIVPGKRGGKPCIKGMRITVYDVLNWLANGMSHKDIINDFPELNENHIKACLAFAANLENRLRVSS